MGHPPSRPAPALGDQSVRKPQPRTDDPLPFLIGRQGENHLVLRDNRTSRSHARIVVESGGYAIEDLGSRHGVFVNGQRVKRHKLKTATGSNLASRIRID